MPGKLQLPLALLIASMLLAFGCVVIQQPAQIAQGNQQPLKQPPAPGNVQSPPAVNERTGAAVSPNETLKPSESLDKTQTTCALTLNPDTIFAGDSTEIGFSVSTKGDAAFTYSCGGETMGISTGGLTNGVRLCQFKEAGEQIVWIKADGEVCAQKILAVKPRSLAPRNCRIDESSIVRNLQDYTYQATVYFDGFEPNDSLTWTCDFTTAKKTIGGDPVLGMPKYSIISCDYTAQPRKDTIAVSVAGVPCGTISTR